MRWSLLFVLLALACKPAVRQAPSDLQAIADDSLTLGVTPVEKDEVQAYRLLVCKKAMSYPKWMLEDESRCLPGLVTEEGDEVIILPDHLKRDFATKYEGYAKATTAYVVPAFALAAVGVFFGPKAAEAVAGTKPVKAVGDAVARPVKWVTRQGFVTTPVDFVKTQWGSFTNWFGNTVRGVTSKVPDRLKLKLDDTAVMDRTVFYYRVEANHAVAKLRKKGIGINPARDKVRTLEAIEELRASHRTKNLLQKQTNLKDEDAVIARITSLNKQIDNEFMSNYEGVKNVQLLGTDGLGDRIKDMRKYHEMKSTREVVTLLEANKTDVKGLANSISLRQEQIIDPRISKLKEDLSTKPGVEFGPAGLRHPVVHRVATATGATAVAAYPVMVSLDKSIWGYSDRQVSKHWSQIFHDQGDFGAESTSVKDLPGVLKSLADAYGFTVNSKALALGN